MIGELNEITDLKEKFEIANLLMDAAKDCEDAHNLIPHTLLSKFIFPVCERWAIEDQQDYRALIWIDTEEALKTALERVPNHPLVSAKLIRKLQSRTWQLLHHLPEGVPDARAAAELVDECEKYLGAWVNENRAQIIWHWRLDRILVDNLLRYEASAAKFTFQEWAGLHGLPASYDEAAEALKAENVTDPWIPD